MAQYLLTALESVTNVSLLDGCHHLFKKLDRTRPKASEICLRSPFDIYSHSSPENAQKPQIWPVSVKGAP